MSSSSHSSFLLLFPLLLLLLLPAVDSGSAPAAAPAPATTDKRSIDPQKLCKTVASDSPSCVEAIESVPGIQKIGDDDAAKIADLCLRFAADRIFEAKKLTLLAVAAAKGKPSSCLKACDTSISAMAGALAKLPDEQYDMKTYLIAKDIRAKFQLDRPPACSKDCWNKTSSPSSADETSIADKFLDIWNVVKVADSQINDVVTPVQ